LVGVNKRLSSKYGKKKGVSKYPLLCHGCRNQFLFDFRDAYKHKRICPKNHVMTEENRKNDLQLDMVLLASNMKRQRDYEEHLKKLDELCNGFK
jgi:hypothetical protein